MKSAALYCDGHLVTGRSHLDAWQNLSEEEKNGHISSGFFDSETGEFSADLVKEHFYHKKILLIRHTTPNIGSDPGLCQQGFSEAVILSNMLKKLDLTDFIGYTSPLLRCLQTTNIISQILHINFRIKSEIMDESHDGFIKNHHKEFPDMSWPTEEDFLTKEETEIQFCGRLEKVLSELSAKCILVTHFPVVQHLARLALCDEKMKAISPASVTYIDNQEVKCLAS